MSVHYSKQQVGTKYFVLCTFLISSSNQIALCFVMIYTPYRYTLHTFRHIDLDKVNAGIKGRVYYVRSPADLISQAGRTTP